MKVTQATYEDSGKGNDRSLYTTINCEIQNKSENTVEMTKGSLLILDEKGVTIGYESDREEESHAETDDSFSVSYSPYIDYPNHVGDVSKLKAIVDVTTFRKEYFKLGEYDCPQDHDSPEKISFEKQTGDIRIHGIYIVQDRVEEDDTSDDRYVQARVYIRNIGNKTIQKVVVKAHLLDKEEAGIEVGEDYRSIPPSASDMLSANVGAKRGKLKGATIKISLQVFYEIEHLHAEEVLTEQNN